VLPARPSPSLSLHPPALEDLLLGSNASLTCTLSGLKSGEGASFTWTPTGGKTAVQGSPKRDSCGCYSVSSVLPGCADPWNSGQTFSCSATHPESKSSLTATIKKDTGGPGPPRVGGWALHTEAPSRARPSLSSPAHPSQRETEARGPGPGGALRPAQTPDPLSAP
uniref:Ig-like domain-containing protein n=1 Tax=Moschus moschiferus TaxID=68415 RepID=A0A8C6E7T1_MOSMO